MLLALQELLGLEDEMTYKSASFLGGGLAATGLTCGALVGGAMVLGMVYGRGNPHDGKNPERGGPAYKLVRWFEREYGHCLCRNLRQQHSMDKAALKAWDASGGHEKCFQICGKVAGKGAEIISDQGTARVSQDQAVEAEKTMALPEP